MIRSRAAGYLAVSMLVAAGGTAIAAPSTAGPPSPLVAGPGSADRVAAAVVAGRPAYLHAGPDDTFVAHPAIVSAGTSYVPYDRTYRGLPVVGGDFVLVVNAAGQVSHASVAQQQMISGISVAPRVDRTVAEKTAGGQLAVVSQVKGTRLVVYALGGAARLAWESTVAGSDAEGVSERVVDVDASTGAVLDSRERIADGTGTSAYNGPNPVTVSTTLTAGHFYMTDPFTSSLSCQDSVNNMTFTNTTDVWGTGNAASKETACVDALFAAQTETKMVSQWLGRNGLAGDGNAWPIRIGLNDENAYYDPANPQLQIGHNTAGKWIPSLDIIGHENGHGIDDHTPGGVSRNGTQEFVADAFGAATEWFANEPAPFDTPDFKVGEMVNLVGSGPIRYMYKPSLAGDPDCYSSSVPGGEVHSSAGPGNHWFYLLAEGANPNDGQPASPTCNGTFPNAVGIQTAIKILYTAMLMKTTASSYPNYRLWTLQAARNLFPNSCREFDAVRNSWSAVSVPAQPGEPICDLSVVFPAPQTSQLGVPITPLRFTAVGGNPPYSWGAVNLPPGLSLNSALGQVTGTPTAAGQYLPQVFVLDSSVPPMRSANNQFSWTITGNSVVPDVIGDTVSQAQSELSAVGLALGTVKDVPDPNCDHIGRVFSQTPRAGSVVPPGTAVNLGIGRKTVPNCP